MKQKRIFIALFILPLAFQVYAGSEYKPDRKKAPKHKDGMTLVWAEDFNRKAAPDAKIWNFEHGFVRNEEHQWYQEKNAFCRKGVLVIEARKEKFKNPLYKAGSKQWRESREFVEYTSSSINTAGKKEFQYGRFEIRAKIDTCFGLWPAIWTLGVRGEWPWNGEIDIMESYPVGGEHTILANVAWGTNRRWTAKWKSEKILLDYFLKKDPDWPAKFHIWRMDWDENYIRLYLDDELLNETRVADTVNPDGSHPFRQPHYILLNMAVGGQNGGDPSMPSYPARYEIDYVRVYQY